MNNIQIRRILSVYLVKMFPRCAELSSIFVAVNQLKKLISHEFFESYHTQLDYIRRL